MILEIKPLTDGQKRGLELCPVCDHKKNLAVATTDYTAGQKQQIICAECGVSGAYGLTLNDAYYGWTIAFNHDY